MKCSSCNKELKQLKGKHKFVVQLADEDTKSEHRENNSQQVNTEDKGSTSPSLPLRKKDKSLEGGCDEDSLAPADTLSEDSEVNK